MIDLDDMEFDKVKYWAERTCNWFELLGYLILQSSDRGYHIVFDRFVTWDENTSIMAWLGIVSNNKNCARAINDKSIHVQCAAMTALGDNGSISAVGRLLIKLKSNDDLLRDAAIRALGNIGSRKAIGPLLELYKDGDFYTKSGVILALGSIGGSSKIYNVLEKALEDNDLHRFAVTSLELLRTDKAEKLLAHANQFL